MVVVEEVVGFRFGVGGGSEYLLFVSTTASSQFLVLEYASDLFAHHGQWAAGAAYFAR